MAKLEDFFASAVSESPCLSICFVFEKCMLIMFVRPFRWKRAASFGKKWVTSLENATSLETAFKLNTVSFTKLVFGSVCNHACMYT